MINLSETINQYLEFCKYMKGLSSKSIKAYSTDLKQFAEWCKNDFDWCSKQIIEEYLMLLYKNFKPKSAKRKIASLKAFFHYLELEEKISSSPFHKIKFKRREPLVLPKSIPIDTLSKILNTAYHTASNSQNSEYQKRNAIRDIAVMELLFASGIRIGELCSLHKEDVDLKNKIIKVNGKGSKERYIQITNKSVQSALKNYQKLFSEEIRKSSFYFINNRGNRLSEQSARFMIDKYARISNIEMHITPHMFRHTVATLLLEENVDIRYIQELLGHSSITTTQIYTHISMSAQKRILTQKHPRNKIKIEKSE